MSAPIHGNLDEPAAADTAQMEWAKSPSGSVWRKRVHLVGPPESGQVTSVVRYEAGARFPAHDHPEGEEILVLDGSFEDERGTHARGAWLRLPRGARHAPRTGGGCTIYVKRGGLRYLRAAGPVSGGGASATRPG